jgi:hypothetical protein
MAMSIHVTRPIAGSYPSALFAALGATVAGHAPAPQAETPRHEEPRDSASPMVDALYENFLALCAMREALAVLRGDGDADCAR